MPAQEPCRQDGCTRARTRHSVFCDEHHQEQLIRAGLRPAVLPGYDARAEQLSRCRRPLRAHEQGLITDGELLSTLSDVLVHGGMTGRAEYWPDCLDALPAGVAEALLAFLRGTARTHAFAPTSPEQLQAARSVQARLVSVLEARIHETRPPGGG